MMTRNADKKREQMLMLRMDDMVPQNHMVFIGQNEHLQKDMAFQKIKFQETDIYIRSFISSVGISCY